MPEVRLIDANALKKAFCDYCSAVDTDMQTCDGNCDTLRIIDEQPTIEPEQRHGRWIEHGGGVVATCSNCNASYIKDVLQSLSPYAEHLTPFCPNCGARMDVGADNG